MEYAMLGIGVALVALGAILGVTAAILARLHSIDADLRRMSAEIHELAKSHVDMAHVLNDIQIAISQAHAMLNEHDQMIAFMRHEQDEDYPVH